MLYLGDVGETFCLALAEAQAMGVPCVVRPVGAVGERVREGETGFIRATDAELADAAVALLRNDALWQHFSQNALNLRPHAGWAQAAQRFAALA
jgi:glycosyltransferase involved in cell wall biosynthesis